jgi:transaldolase
MDAVNAGAHILTVTPAVLEKMLEHEFSRKTVQQFEADAKKLKGVK